MQGHDIRSYLVQGPCPEFFRGLERMTTRYYKRHRVDESFDIFYDSVRDKVLDILSAGVYDEAKGKLSTLVTSMIRNEATKANSKNSKRTSVDDMAHPEPVLVPRGPEAVSHYREKFVSLAASRCVEVDMEKLVADLQQRIVTPMVFAYLWKLEQGGRRAIRV